MAFFLHHTWLFMREVLSLEFSPDTACFGSPLQVQHGKRASAFTSGVCSMEHSVTFCIWGAIAMLTSAPFDDWWHNTYGLDVTILSPPHTVLLLGMIMIQFGAIVSVLNFKNLHSERANEIGWLDILLPFSQGFVLAMTFTMGSEYMGRQICMAFYFIRLWRHLSLAACRLCRFIAQALGRNTGHHRV
jgi:hypothetical protein